MTRHWSASMFARQDWPRQLRLHFPRLWPHKERVTRAAQSTTFAKRHMCMQLTRGPLFFSFRWRSLNVGWDSSRAGWDFAFACENDGDVRHCMSAAMVKDSALFAWFNSIQSFFDFFQPSGACRLSLGGDFIFCFGISSSQTNMQASSIMNCLHPVLFWEKQHLISTSLLMCCKNKYRRHHLSHRRR